MNKDDFIKLINLLVEKKMKELLPGMIEDAIKTHMESGIQPSTSDFDDDDDLKNLIPRGDFKSSIIRDDSNKPSKRTESVGKKWTKNPVINQILNQTANDPSFKGVPKDPTDGFGGKNYQQMLSEEYESIGDEFSFNTKNMTDVVHRPTPNMGGGSKPAAVNNLKNQVMNEVPGAQPEIVNAMVKDYSKVLKSLDKAAKKTRGGGPPLGSGIGESW